MYMYMFIHMYMHAPVLFIQLLNGLTYPTHFVHIYNSSGKETFHKCNMTSLCSEVQVQWLEWVQYFRQHVGYNAHMYM